MEITREETKGVRFSVKCIKCGENIRGVSEKHLLSNLRSHLLLKHSDDDEGAIPIAQ